MAIAGDRFAMPDGSVYVVNKPAAETDGEFVEMEFVLPDGCVPPPPHVHPHQVEEYEVLEGRFDVMVDGTWQTLGPGETASVPIGVSHTFRNRSGGVVRARNWHRPAMRFEEYIQEIHDTLDGAGITRKLDPRLPVYLSAIMLDYPETLAPSRTRERIPMRALAQLARFLPRPDRGG